MTNFNEALDTLARDGYVVVPDVFNADEVRQAHAEILALRASLDVAPHAHVEMVRLGRSTEILTNLYGTCPMLDRLVDQLLTDEALVALLMRIGGKHLKNRDYTCRIMTGEPDEWSGYNPPLEWHRDSKGEFVIGIYLTDIPAGDNSATAFLPGTHRWPFDPRWNALFGRPFYLGSSKLQRRFGAWHGLSLFLKANPFARALGRRIREGATGAFGKVGDIYVFINDTWHGRLPNREGRKCAVVQLGFFPSEFPFPDSPWTPPEALQAQLPAGLRRVLDRQQPNNVRGRALMYEVIAAREKCTGLFWWVRLERNLAQLVSSIVVLPYVLVRRAVGKLLRATRLRS